MQKQKRGTLKSSSFFLQVKQMSVQNKLRPFV